MSIYAQSEIDIADSTVEMYLLNFWTKDLSTRDLADRIALCAHNAGMGDKARETGFSVHMIEDASPQ